MAPVAAPDDVTRAWLALDTTGRAHVGFALAEPGLFRTAFAVPPDLVSLSPVEGIGPTAPGPDQLLSGALDALLA